MALIINELVSNAGKYAYPDRPGGSIWVEIVQLEEREIFVSVRDEGVGLPVGYDPTASKRLGTRLVMALSKQLDANLARTTSAAGTNFTLHVPLQLRG